MMGLATEITYLLSLRVAHEYSQPPYNRDTNIPEEYNWESLIEKSGSQLEQHYVTLLRELGIESGMLGQIFLKAQNKIQDPENNVMLKSNGQAAAVLPDNVLFEGGAGKMVRKNSSKMRMCIPYFVCLSASSMPRE